MTTADSPDSKDQTHESLTASSSSSVPSRPRLANNDNTMMKRSTIDPPTKTNNSNNYDDGPDFKHQMRNAVVAEPQRPSFAMEEVTIPLADALFVTDSQINNERVIGLEVRNRELEEIILQQQQPTTTTPTPPKSLKVWILRLGVILTVLAGLAGLIAGIYCGTISAENCRGDAVGGGSESVSSPASSSSSSPPPTRPPTPTLVTATARPTDETAAIVAYINDITLVNRTLRYPNDGTTAEERALQWLIDDDLYTTPLQGRLDGDDDSSTTPDDKQSLLRRYVLATLWFQPSDDIRWGGPDHKKTWTTNITECRWHGVTCQFENFGFLTSLNLRDSNITRSRIPEDLGLLTSLETLLFDINQMTGTIPSSLGSLTALHYFHLWSNLLTGSIPSSLGSLTALTTFSLFNNLLTGTIPSSLGSLTALTALYLNTNRLTGTIPSSLGSLTAVNKLHLHDNELTGTIPSTLGSLTALLNLWLQENQLIGTIPSSLGSLTALNYLYLHTNQLTGTIPSSSLEMLPAMIYLALSENQLTGTIPSSLGLLTALTQLWLNDNPLTGTIPLSLCTIINKEGFDFKANCLDQVNCTC